MDGGSNQQIWGDLTGKKKRVCLSALGRIRVEAHKHIGVSIVSLWERCGLGKLVYFSRRTMGLMVDFSHSVINDETSMWYFDIV